ncbi:importin-5 [Tanacetum coccineum]
MRSRTGAIPVPCDYGAAICHMGFNMAHPASRSTNDIDISSVVGRVQLPKTIHDNTLFVSLHCVGLELHNVFEKCLGNVGSADVRIAALSAVINFIQCLESGNDRDRFQDLLPGMMLSLTEALNGGNEATAQEALELLIEATAQEATNDEEDEVSSSNLAFF